jgi:hypothetical protein
VVLTGAAESVVIARSAKVLQAWVDSANQKVYLDDPAADLRAGDLITFRGVTTRITVQPEVWAGAGIVATYEPPPPLLPD